MKPNLIFFGHPILRLKAKPVVDFSSELLALIDAMYDCICNPAHLGVGLAAPQMGISLRLFISLEENGMGQEGQEYRPSARSEVKVYINPELSHPSKEGGYDEEGCLSIPGVRASVWRPNTIRVRAQDQTGAFFEEELGGFPARIAMHENDHLNGVFFVDRIEKRDKWKVRPLLQRIKNRSRGI